jgi:hypothetical protein
MFWKSAIALGFFLFAPAFELSAQTDVQPNGSAKVYTNDFSFETEDGRRVVPLPDGAWHHIFDEMKRETLTAGPYAETWDRKIIFLARAVSDRVTAIVVVDTNNSILPNWGLVPVDFCYSKQPNWNWHKQVSAIPNDTFCWGVRYIKFHEEPPSGTWSRVTEKFERLGWIPPSGAGATHVAFFKSDKGTLLAIDYMFIGSKDGAPIHWQDARNWAEGLIPRVIAGFKGKRVGDTGR